MAEENVPVTGVEFAPVKPDQLRVAAFGDSLMWGQGLARTERFARIITDALAIEHQKPATLVIDRPRSGAEIEADAAQRDAFRDTFPDVFAGSSPMVQKRFLDGSDERLASRLHGEIPATFPTVAGQVDIVDTTVGASIDVALLSGGANDIAFDRVINPQVAPGRFVETFDADIRRISHDMTLDLIRRTRTKCPNAVLLVFGYYAPLSHDSDRELIKAFFKHEADDDVGWFINGFFGFVDIGHKIDEAVTRSLWAQGRAQHWIRRAVTEANRTDAVRGPGVLFIPSAFGPENAVFAQSSFLHRDFTHPTKDLAQAERQLNCPRVGQLADMERLRTLLLVGPEPAGARALAGAISGPRPLRKRLTEHAAKPGSTATRTALRGELDTEIGRIRRALIASFLHPNAAGARSYADQALARYRGHRRTIRRIKREKVPGSAAAQGETVAARLQGYRLRQSASLRGDIGHLDVDALTLVTDTAAGSDANLALYAWLVVTTREEDGSAGRRVYQLNMRYRFPKTVGPGPPSISVRKFYPQLEPGERNRFTLDTAGGLRLEAITGTRIVLGADPFAGESVFRHDYGTTWRPSRVALEVNGVQVLDMALPAAIEVGPGESVDLGYPAPQPGFVAPELVGAVAEFI
jgi:hypothetical protein